MLVFIFFFQAEDGIRDLTVTGVQTCALPIFEAHRPDLLREQLGLRLRDAELVDHPDAVLARQLRQDRAEPRAVHLAVHLVREVLVRRIRKNLAAAAPQRARGHAGAGPARAFLPPWLLGGVVDRAAILLRALGQRR